MKTITRFTWDLIYALYTWVSIWKMDIERLKRRKRFFDSIIDDKRKKDLPARILYAAYRKRGIL